MIQRTILFLYWLSNFLLSICELFWYVLYSWFQLFTVCCSSRISGSMDHCMAELDAILDCRCSWRVAAILLGRIRALPRPQSIQCRYEYLMNLLFSMARPWGQKFHAPNLLGENLFRPGDVLLNGSVILASRAALKVRDVVYVDWMSCLLSLPFSLRWIVTKTLGIISNTWSCSS